MTSVELDNILKEIEEFCTETRELLAEELGGDSEDYRATVAASSRLTAATGNCSTTSTETLVAVPCAPSTVLTEATVSQGVKRASQTSDTLLSEHGV